jgi:hypothetical protein
MLYCSLQLIGDLPLLQAMAKTVDCPIRDGSLGTQSLQHLPSSPELTRQVNVASGIRVHIHCGRNESARR